MTEKRINHKNEIQEKIRSNLEIQEKKRKNLRFQRSLQNFMDGNTAVIENDEFIQGLFLSLTTEILFDNDQTNELLDALLSVVLSEISGYRERVLPILYSVSDFFLNEGDSCRITCIYAVMLEWLKEENEIFSGTEAIILKIEESIAYYLERSKFEEAENGLVLFQRIKNGSLPKNPALKAMVSRSLTSFNSRQIATEILEIYLKNPENRVIYQSLLFILGQDCIVAMLEKAVACEDRDQQIQLVRLIVQFGSSAVPSLLRCLEGNPSWAVVRCMVFILGEIRDSENYFHIEQFHDYPDERVQLETINAVIKLGGEECRERLINALYLVNERLKIHLLKLLLEEKKTDVAFFNALLHLARQRATFSFSTGLELITSILTACKLFPEKQTVDMLKSMKVDYQQITGVEHIVLLIDETLNVIEPRIRHCQQQTANTGTTVSFDEDPVQKQIARSFVQGVEIKIDNLLKKKDNRAAAMFIYEQTVNAVRQRNFIVAEILRDRLLEIDPFALEKVVELGRQIEEQKATGITRHHIEVWKELYDTLSTEEFNALYYNCRMESYDKNEVIVKSGEVDNSLFFLNSGNLAIFCKSSGNETFVRKASSGEVFGSEQFFSASVWTVTLKALTPVQLQVLDQEGWREVLRSSAAVEEKLERFCEKMVNVSNILKTSGDDRRESHRYPLSGRTRHILLDSFGKKAKKSFYGDLVDLSRNGMAFTIQLVNRQAAKKILGRQIISYFDSKESIYPEFFGMIVGVHQLDTADGRYSVHVKLAKCISEKSFRQLLGQFG